MAYLNSYFILCSILFKRNFAASAIEVPSDVEIQVNVSAKTVNVSWKSPVDHDVIETLVELRYSQNQKVVTHKYVKMPSTNWLVTKQLQHCEEYFIDLRFRNQSRRFSDIKRHKFIIHDIKYTSIIGSNKTISWETSLENFYIVKLPSGTVLYDVSPAGSITVGSSKVDKYQFDANATSIIKITVRNVTKSDAGLYTAFNKLSQKVDSCAVLIVTDIPTTPHLSVKSQQVFVGDNVTFTCNSSTQRWPEYVTSSLSYTFYGIEGFRDGQHLVVKLKSRNKKGLNITCTATDDRNLTSAASNPITLKPFYGPDAVYIDEYQMKINVTEGAKLRPFKCRADCNPSCEIEWRFNNSAVSMDISGSLLNLTNIKRDQSGTYRCMARHKFDSKRNETKAVSVNVLYGPVRVNITRWHQIMKVSEGDTLEPVNCMADCNPSCLIQWKTNITGKFENVSPESRLNIKNITREQSGTYRCEADYVSDDNKSKWRDLVIRVQYGPDKVNIEPYHRTYNITEGDTLGPFNCSASCYPSCDIKWRLKRTSKFERFISTSVLQIPSIRRNQSGIFRCKAIRTSNSTNFKRSDITVNVQYPPKIREVCLNATKYSEEHSHTFVESKNLDISIEIEGNPDSSVSFFKSQTSKGPINHNKKGNTYSFRQGGLRCEDSGQFTIKASNGINNSSIKTVQLDIQCKPRNLLFESQLIGTSKGSVVNITLTVVANPRPHIEWIRITNHDWKVTELGHSKYRGSSQITVYDEKSFGVYGMKICNFPALGCTKANVTIKAEGKPDPPQNFSIVEMSHNWARLHFVAGFDGGQKQTFTIHCTPIGTTKANVIVQTVASNDTRKDAVVHHTIEGLLANTQYNITIIAANLLGNSSTSLDCYTNIEPVSFYAAFFTMPGVMLGGSVGISIVILLLVLILIYKRRKHEEENTSTDNVPIEDLKPLTTGKGDGAEYASVSKVQKSSSKSTSAEALIEENNEYAEVDRSNRWTGPSKEDDKDETMYSTPDRVAVPGTNKTPIRTPNDEGLLYIELEFTKVESCKGRRPIIHGDDSKTDYVDIDFTKKADPLPESDDDVTVDSGQ